MEQPIYTTETMQPIVREEFRTDINRTNVLNTDFREKMVIEGDHLHHLHSGTGALERAEMRAENLAERAEFRNENLAGTSNLRGETIPGYTYTTGTNVLPQDGMAGTDEEVIDST